MNPDAAARRPSARLWRIVGGTAAGLLIFAALAITALRLALVYLPEHATRLRAWAERETNMRIEYSHLDARLRWYGPELVLRDMRVLDQDGSQALFVTREGSVGLDVWNFFRTGQFVAGRVRLVAPRLTIERFADGHIGLLGQSDQPSNRPPFDFDRIPAGRLVVEDATVILRHEQPGVAPLQLTKLDLSLRRDRGFVLAEGTATLPASLGTTIDFSARLKGSLGEAERLDSRVEVQFDDLRLAGLRDRLPDDLARPLDGRGSGRIVVSRAAGVLQGMRVQFDLHDVALRMPTREVPDVEAVQVSPLRLEEVAGRMPYSTVTLSNEPRPASSLPGEVRYAALRGDLKLRREAGAWKFQAQDVHADGMTLHPVLRTARSVAATRSVNTMSVSGRLYGNLQTRFELELDAKAVDVPALWPLALAFAPHGFDRWAGLGPTGMVASLHIAASRERAGLAPTFTVAADVTNFGLQAHERAPGISGITAKVQGSDAEGALQLRAIGPELDWPRLFRAPIKLERASADIRWKRDGESWVLSTRGAELVHAQAKARVNFALTYFRRQDVSPVLDMTAAVNDIDVTSVAKFLPIGRMHERTIAWLDGAFKRGHATNGRLTLRGPVRKFPFREGEGQFIATVDASDITLDYFPGFAPLTAASGTARFNNASIGAKINAGQIAGLKLAGVDFKLADYKFPVLDIAGAGTGDLGGALQYVQHSPLGARLGTVFMGLAGAGPTQYQVKLVLPIIAPDVEAPEATPRTVDYRVNADLDSVTVTTPILRAPVQKVTGKFALHNQEISLQDVRGTILDGPFELAAEPGRTNRDVAVAVDFTAHGTAGGARLPAFIGLPPGIRMAGSTPWDLRGRIEKHKDNPRWPVQINVNSSLAGLQVLAPKPFAKEPTETRPTRVRLDMPGNAVDDVAVESGTARARLRFADREGKWQLERGAARFDGQPVALPPQPGMLVTGNWPEFDLSEWLALGNAAGAATSGPAAAGTRLGDWLGPVDVHFDRAKVVGYRFNDLMARLRLDGDTWRIEVAGPQAQGLVSVPDELQGGRPIVLEMKRLYLQGGVEPGARNATARLSEPDSDPRTLPAITARAEDFAWEGRRFGQLQAVLVKDPRGLVFQSLGTTAPEFTIEGHGSWLVENGVPHTRVSLDATSTDLSAMLRALAYRDAIDAHKAHFAAMLDWSGGPSADILSKLDGTMKVTLEDGQLRNVEPGAGRMLGLLSVAALPRRLSLDFHDVTDKGLAFDKVHGDFELRDGNAHTQNLLLKGPAVDIGVVGRTGLGTEDYDQTIVVSGNPGGPIAVASFVAGPVIGTGVLVLTQLFKGQLQGLTRAYYHVTGPWESPVVERISAASGESASDSAAPATTVPVDPPATGGQP